MIKVCLVEAPDCPYQADLIPSSPAGMNDSFANKYNTGSHLGNMSSNVRLKTPHKEIMMKHLCLKHSHAFKSYKVLFKRLHSLLSCTNKNWEI